MLAFGAAAGANRGVDAFTPGNDVQHGERIAGVAHGDGGSGATVVVERAGGYGAGGEGCRHGSDSFTMFRSSYVIKSTAITI